MMVSSLKHIAIIPDGNRRWAKKKGLPFFLGHREGAKTVEKIFETAVKLKIPFITFWGCSVGNVTKRSKAELSFLFKLFEQYFKKLAKSENIHKNKIKINAMGRWEEFFPESVKKSIKKAIKVTKDYKNFQITFLLAYSGVEETTNAIQRIAELRSKNEELRIDKNLIKNNLWTKDLPSVDLVIRTGEEANWSHWSEGFMMWDTANAQFYFTKTLWPDFSAEELKKAVEKFSGIERRLGK